MKNLKIAKFLCATLIVAVSVGYWVLPPVRTAWNTVFTAVRQADDASSYKTKKKVADTCRAMIASYNSDRLTFMQYVRSENEEKREWAEQAKLRANMTASMYNNYVLVNSFVFEGNVPKDIRESLTYLD